MNLELSGRVALITGSSRGIGKSIAKILHDEGCHIVLNGRNSSALESASKEIGKNVDYFVADVTDPTSCKSLVNETKKQCGKLDILICNVGSGTSVSPGKETLEEWQRILNINLGSTTNMVEAATSTLAETRGSIVCISSICGIEVLDAPITYSVAKAALNAYIRGIARPLAKYGIRINAVAPGNILFKGSVWEKKLAENSSLVNNMLEKEVILKRLGTPEEIANFVAFLASSRSSFSTGSVYVVDGGQVRS